MRRVLVCGMLLVFFTSLSYAQRGHSIGGVGPMARSRGAALGGIHADSSKITPNPIGVGHDGVSPNAIPLSTRSKTVSPNAAGDPSVRTTHPNATTMPDARPVPPDAERVPGRVNLPDGANPVYVGP